MKKTFCDCCDTEITDSNKIVHDQIVLNGHVLNLYSHDKFDTCKYCFIDTVKRLDDRPMPANKPDPATPMAPDTVRLNWLDKNRQLFNAETTLSTSIRHHIDNWMRLIK